MEEEITFEFSTHDDCLDKMVPSDLRIIVSERDQLRAHNAELELEVARLHKKVKYQYLYTSFLLDQTSEETFKALAPEYDEYLNIEREIEVAKAAFQAKLSALESEIAIAKAGIEAMTVRIK